jgi:hypothetical protein
MFMKDFKPEEFEFKHFDPRFSLFGMMYPYRTWFYFGKIGGFPAPMRKGNPFPPEAIMWVSKWGLILGIPLLFAFCYNLVVSVMVKDGEGIWKALGGLTFLGWGIWFAYNIRRGYRDGIVARIAEEEEKKRNSRPKPKSAPRPKPSRRG